MATVLEMLSTTCMILVIVSIFLLNTSAHPGHEVIKPGCLYTSSTSGQAEVKLDLEVKTMMRLDCNFVRATKWLLIESWAQL